MGRKMKATKSGKFINPTDQARKEARKRELRKNKKQRLIVRTAVLKGKDPYQILADLERLDRMEYDVDNPPVLNEKVLKDKRRKLKETWDRICRLYSKEDKQMYGELKRIEADYEMKRGELSKHFDAVRSAQEVNLDEIPLPSLPTEPLSLPAEVKSGSILKSTQRNKQPPGCPPGLPPLLSEFDPEDESESEEEEEPLPKKKIRFSDEVSSNKDNVKDFLKEIEQLAGDKEDKTEKKTPDLEQSTEDVPIKSLSSQPPPSAFPYPASGFYPNPVQPAPVVMNPPKPPPALSAQPMRHSIRNPNPGFTSGPPPPRAPPRLPPSSHQTTRNPPNPSSSSYYRPEKPRQGSTTIEAKPQLRNLSADSVKFMPLTLRVKRDEKQVTKKPSAGTKQSGGYGMFHSAAYSGSVSTVSKSKESNAKDDAYEQFMSEIGGLF